MKFSIEQQELLNAVSTVEKFVPSKTLVSILTGIKFVIYDDMISLAATDLDMGILYKIEKKDENISIDESGSIVIGAKILSEIIRKIPPGRIDIMGSEEKLDLTAGKFQMVLPCFSAMDFPEITTESTLPVLTFGQKEFKNMIRQVIYARADETTSRPQLTGVLVEVKDNVLNMVALDGFRIAWRKQDLGDKFDGENFEVIIPGKTLMEISRIFSDDEEENFELYIANNKVEFRTANTIISSRILEGNFLDYEKVIKPQGNTIVEIKTDDLYKAIDRANILARATNKNNLFKMKITDNQIEVIAESEMGKTSDKLSCKTQGEDLYIAFNASFFIDALRPIEYPLISLDFSNDTGPCIISPSGVDNHINFILPVKLRSEDF